MREKERNLGIDLLRMAAMYLVVVLHLLMKILPEANSPGLFFELSWLMETVAFASVDCYALISGYVGAGRRVSLGRAAVLWLQVAFYSMGVAALSELIAPGSAGEEAKLALTPILTGRYWYVSAYFCLMLFLPVLEAGINSVSTRTLGGVALGLTALCFPVVFMEKVQNSIFGFGSGYNAIWLAVLYIIGAYLRRSALLKRLKMWQMVTVYILCVGITWLNKLRGSWRYLNYVSPTVLLAAVMLVLIFSRLKLPSWAGKTVKVMSPAALGVYLIHINPIIYNAFTVKLSLGFPEYSAPVFVLLVAVTALAVYLVCTGIELVRIRLFALLRIPRLSPLIDSWAGKIAERLENFKGKGKN